jgi:hypothetical protein
MELGEAFALSLETPTIHPIDPVPRVRPFSLRKLLRIRAIGADAAAPAIFKNTLLSPIDISKRKRVGGPSLVECAQSSCVIKITSNTRWKSENVAIKGGGVPAALAGK